MTSSASLERSALTAAHRYRVHRTGERIVVDFRQGRPRKLEVVLFRPDEELMDCCDNVYEEWCPNSNLFASPELATQWAEQHTMRGRVLDLDEASDLATKDWGDVI